MPNSNGSRRNLYFLSCVLFGCSKYVDLQTERREREREREREKRLFVGVYIDRYSSSLLDGYRLPICSRHREKKKTGQFRWIKIEAWSPGPGQSFSRKSTSFFLFVSLLLTHRDANKRLNIDTDHSRRAVAVNSWASMERERERQKFFLRCRFDYDQAKQQLLEIAHEFSLKYLPALPSIQTKGKKKIAIHPTFFLFFVFLGWWRNSKKAFFLSPLNEQILLGSF